ncbi:MAG: hypothetical protein IPO15_00255 [Anaerolineae bacterium]|uniref:VOC family protein n=1 Tax=Candidatus Amarolinea dominans TaxID=3140696 RepID=UPI0031371D4C|nr:hypothetical protein [Anaerolineae bacterium]
MNIHELRLKTNRLQEQRDFYHHLLGFPLLTADADQVALQVGSSTLIFAAAATPIPAPYHFAFDIPEGQFAEAKAWLAARVPLLTDASGADEFDFSAWNAHAIYFADRDGNIGEFIARHDLPSPATRAFGATSLLSISEIGLAVDNVLHLVERLQTSIHLPVYRQHPTATFTAMGDEHGLLIVVKDGRRWFPEERVAAHATPLTVVISDATAGQRTIHGPPYQIA